MTDRVRDRRLAMAEKIEAAHPDRFCWAELVMWAMFKSSTLHEMNTNNCRDGAAGYIFKGACYCGKYRHALFFGDDDAGHDPKNVCGVSE